MENLDFNPNMIPAEFFIQNPFCQKFNCRSWSDLARVQEWLDAAEREAAEQKSSEPPRTKRKGKAT